MGRTVLIVDDQPGFRLSVRELLEADQRMKAVATSVLDEAFDIARSVRHATRGIEALNALDLD